MLEKELSAIIKTLQGRTIAEKDAIVLKDAIAKDIPRSIKNYLQGEAADALWHEAATLRHFQRLKGMERGGDKVTRSLFQGLALEYIFSRDQFQSALSDAVHFVGNFVCRPRSVLTHFLFKKSDAISSEELLIRLDRFSDYQYLITLLSAYVSREGISQLRRQECSAILEKLDDRVVKQHNARELATLAKPIFQFYLLARRDNRASIPIEPLLAFYDDKKLYILKEYVERICAIRKNTELTQEELAAIAEDLYLDDANAHKTNQSAMKASADKTLPDADPGPSADDVLEGEEISENDAARITRDPFMNAAVEQFPDIHTLIGEEQRARFVKTIFKKDPHFYDGIIASLNRTRTWKEASIQLHEFYETNGLDPFSQTVVEFTETIYNRYTSRKTSQ
jgi:hypothetical protein